MTSAKRCFIITPIGGVASAERRHADMVFEAALRPTLEPLGYSLERSDKTIDAGQITTAIFDALLNADLCIADLSFLNPNVLYELGVRHAFRKPVIQIAADGTRLPFDTANQRTIFFDTGDIHSLRNMAAAVEAQARRIEQDGTAVTNPLTHALGLIELSAAGDPSSMLLDDLAARIESLESRVEMPSDPVAPGIFGQGELATKNVQDLRRMWLIDQALPSIDWTTAEDGSLLAEHEGFTLCVYPQSKGRWSSTAKRAADGFSVPWPTWQLSADGAKRAILGAVIDTIQPS